MKTKPLDIASYLLLASHIMSRALIPGRLKVFCRSIGLLLVIVALSGSTCQKVKREVTRFESQTRRLANLTTIYHRELELAEERVKVNDLEMPSLENVNKALSAVRTDDSDKFAKQLSSLKQAIEGQKSLAPPAPSREIRFRYASRLLELTSLVTVKLCEELENAKTRALGTEQARLTRSLFELEEAIRAPENGLDAADTAESSKSLEFLKHAAVTDPRRIGGSALMSGMGTVLDSTSRLIGVSARLDEIRIVAESKLAVWLAYEELTKSDSTVFEQAFFHQAQANQRAVVAFTRRKSPDDIARHLRTACSELERALTDKARSSDYITKARLALNEAGDNLEQMLGTSVNGG